MTSLQNPEPALQIVAQYRWVLVRSLSAPEDAGCPPAAWLPRLPLAQRWRYPTRRSFQITQQSVEGQQVCAPGTIAQNAATPAEAKVLSIIAKANGNTISLATYAAARSARTNRQ